MLDFETTGLLPERHDRVIEIGVVHVAPDGEIEGRWETLVNPERDLGPQRIHGIAASEARQAPTFEQLASDFIQLLAGRVVVAHNASFEARCLRAELSRVGAWSPLENNMALCTMRLAHKFLPGAGRSLADCCAAFDIELFDAHEAIADARATAQLLAAYLAHEPRHPLWDEYARLASTMEWPTISFPNAGWVTRSRENRAPRSFLELSADRLPGIVETRIREEDAREYLALIDHALADGLLSVEEADALHALAVELGIDETDRRHLHARYFADLVGVVWADRLLSSSEEAEVRAVGVMLDIAPAEIQASLAKPPELAGPAMRAAAHVHSTPATSVHLEPGDLVVLTGEMRNPRELYENALREQGYVPHPAVTKKVRLLVAADVDTMSGKARKAREYGIPVVDEEWLAQLLSLVD